jgi:putative copper export protein
VTRRQIHRTSLTGLLAFIVALCIALAMLGHATMAGGPQWSAGALFAVFVVLGIAGIVGIFLTYEVIADGRERRRAHAGPRR